MSSARLDSFLATNGPDGCSVSARTCMEGALARVSFGFDTALQPCPSRLVKITDNFLWQGQMPVHDAMRYFAGQSRVPAACDLRALHLCNSLCLHEGFRQIS